MEESNTQINFLLVKKSEVSLGLLSIYSSLYEVLKVDVEIVAISGGTKAMLVFLLLPECHS